MTPTVIQRLREALRLERQRGAFPGLSAKVRVEGETDDAIAAIEQELAAKDAEIAELRKRPTLEEVLAAMDRVPRDSMGVNMGVAACAIRVNSLYAEKARAEAPK